MTDLAALRRAVMAAARDLDADRLPDLVGILAAANAVAVARLATPPPAPVPRLATAEELAEAHQVPVTWFRSAARDGLIPSVRHGHHLRFDADAVRRALADRPALRRRGRRDDEHRILDPAEAEKRSNGKGPLPGCYHDETVKNRAEASNA